MYELHLFGLMDDAQREALLGLTLAYLGRSAEAVQRAERGAALLPTTQDAELGAYVRLILARTYVLAGRQDKAMDVLTALVAVPWYVTPAWLRIDPTWALLRGNRRFQQLTTGSP